jgi:hypothetical protein
VLEVAQVFLAWVAGGHAQDLVVAAFLVGHPEHADRTAADQAAGKRGFQHQHKRVERIAVFAQGVRHEAVVGRVLGRGEQRSVEADQAAGVVDLVLVPAAPRDLDPDIELHGAQPFRGVIQTLGRGEPGDNVLPTRGWAVSSGQRHNGCSAVPTTRDRVDAPGPTTAWAGGRIMAA